MKYILRNEKVPDQYVTETSIKIWDKSLYLELSSPYGCHGNERPPKTIPGASEE